MAALLALIGAGCGAESGDASAHDADTASGDNDAAAGSEGSGEPDAGAALAQDNLVQRARYVYGESSSLAGNPGPSFVEIVDVEVGGDHVFVCTATQGLLIVDRSVDSFPIVGDAIPSAGGSRCQNVAVTGSRAMIANRGDEFSPVPHLTLFDVSDPREPTEIADVTSDTLSFEGVAALPDGGFAAALHDDGVGFFQDGGNGELVEGQRVSGLSNAWALTPYQDVLYVADGAGGVRVIDRSKPRAQLATHVQLSGSIKHVEIGGSLLFASAGADGVHVLRLADPTTPTLITTIATPGSALMSSYTDGHLFVADWNDVRVFDLSDPTAPRLVATENIQTGSFSRVLALDAASDRAYLGEWTGLYSYQFFAARSAPDLRLGVFSLQFPQTSPGDESAQSLILENEGTEPLTISSVQADDDYQPLADEVSIPAGMRDFIEIRFRPQSTSPSLGELTLQTNDPDELRASVALEGNAGGLGVGDPIPFETDPAGSWDWTDVQSSNHISIEGELGSVIMLSYFATF